MKKLLIYLFPCFLLGSCGIHPPAPTTDSFYIDYRPLTESGYYITESPSVSFPYEAKGSIIVTSKGGWVKTSTKDPKTDYYISATSYYNYKDPDLNQAYDELKKRLDELGANGVVNIRITSQIRYSEVVKRYYGEITITGMAIKK